MKTDNIDKTLRSMYRFEDTLNSGCDLPAPQELQETPNDIHVRTDIRTAIQYAIEMRNERRGKR